MTLVRTFGIVGGRLRIDGTRMPAYLVWGSCTRGDAPFTPEEFVSCYEGLVTLEQVQEVLDYGKASEANAKELEQDRRSALGLCAWCGSDMRIIGMIQTGMSAGRGHVWLCEREGCGHEEERAF